MQIRTAVPLWIGIGIAPSLAFGADTTAYGTGSLSSVTTGTYNSAFGYDALSEIMAGSNNTAVGSQAMAFGNSSYNTAVGSLSAQYLTGVGNVAVGYSAMAGNSGYGHAGNYNIAIGSQALAAPGATDYSEDVVAIGYYALNKNVTEGNTGVGAYALYLNTTGEYNVALGLVTLGGNITGSRNTAIGFRAIDQGGAAASDNTALGYEALRSAQSDGNTAVGSNALYSATTGSTNTALGQYAAYQTTTGSDNVAIGSEAMRFNTTGSQNMALGRSALRNSSSGGFNSVIGYASCWSCKSASQNVGIGFKSLYSLSSGTGNVAVGNSAGYNLTGTNNVDIANTGMSGDSGVIRIGAPSTHTKAYIAGIATSKVTGAPVYVTSDGQLGTQASALRYKTEVKTLGDPADRLSQLRPVSFHLKTDPNGPLQYGLIAEEVATVYPDLVIRDERGVTQGVRYDELAPLLLKQLQRQKAQIASLQVQSKELNDLKARLAALEGAVHSQTVASTR